MLEKTMYVAVLWESIVPQLVQYKYLFSISTLTRNSQLGNVFQKQFHFFILQASTDLQFACFARETVFREALFDKRLR